MHKSSLLIIRSCLMLSVISVFYFFSLGLNIPVVITTLLVAAFVLFLFRWTSKQNLTITCVEANDKSSPWSYVILAAGLFILVNKAFYLETKYGEWDAWFFWNLHAKYLSNPAIWTRPYFDFYQLPAFTSPVAHADYPLFLPAAIGYFWRLIGAQPQLVPFGLSMLMTIFIPVLIFLELYKKNLLVSGLVLLLFATDDIYIKLATSQYADGFVALFFLLAFICIHHYRESNKPAFLVLASAFLGSCMWTKNEGIMLSFIFLFYYSLYFLKKQRWRHVVYGLIVPLIALVAFKLHYAPPNDLVGGQDADLINKLMDKSRYNMIWDFFQINVNNFFPYLKYFLIGYGILCIVEKKLPDREFLIILAAMTGFTFIYLTTPNDLDWHLQTSLDRIIFQLIPATTYLFAKRLTVVRLKIG